MKITPDTNLLVRVVMRDDEAQARKALELLSAAELVVLSLPCLCEFVWVLDSVYGLPRGAIASSIRTLMMRANASGDEPAVSAGLRLLDAGGDFADGVIAASGAAMGGRTFVSFDRKAVARLQAIGLSARDADAIA